MTTIPTDSSEVKLNTFTITNGDVVLYGTEAAIVLGYLRQQAIAKNKFFGRHGNLSVATDPDAIAEGTGIEMRAVVRALIILTIAQAIDEPNVVKEQSGKNIHLIKNIKPADEVEEE